MNQKSTVASATQASLPLRSVRAPELMAPAGGWPQMRAAVQSGADAVYFGIDHFSARAKVGFQADELPEIFAFLHERGVQGFVTFNTLVFDDELHKARRAIAAIARAGADAVIVQDIGVTSLIRQVAPHLTIHGSTQMTVTSAEGAEFAKRLGCSRVVLGRELALTDIERIASSTDVELEVFVHGALCVSYSGQCFSSEAWGGRSANRGQCAQACRLSWELVVDDEVHDTGANRYLLSPGDLFTLAHIPDLVRLGIACCKIEGRYKDEYYVAATTRAYRQAIDRACLDDPLSSSELEAERRTLEQLYSRGLGPWFLQGVDHQQVVEGRAPRHRGVEVGTVVAVGKDWVDVHLTQSLTAGDGIVFDAADWRSPDEPEEGGNVYHVTPSPHTRGTSRLTFAHGSIDTTRIREMDRVWRTSSHRVLVPLKPLARSQPDAPPGHTRPVSLTISGRLGEALAVTMLFDEGQTVAVTSRQPLQAAANRALDKSSLQTQLGRLGGTPFHLESLNCDFGGEALFLPVSQLNELRRELVDKALAVRSERTARTKTDVDENGIDLPAKAPVLPPRFDRSHARLHVLVRNPNQLDAAIACRPASITLDYLELYGLRPSVEKIQQANIAARVASPRILKPSEQNVIRFLTSLDCGIVVRSAGLLEALFAVAEDARPQLIGDFSLNVANRLSAEIFRNLGLTKLTPTWDLNAGQIANLASCLPEARLEVCAWSHLPVFHTEHCVFCRFLSNGTDHTNCGHPCEKHQVALRDQRGRLHPVMADVGCRNTIFGGEAQTAPGWLDRWLASGIRDFRLEFAHESAEQVQQIYLAFSCFFATDGTAGQLRTELNQLYPAGTTLGSYHVPAERAP